MNFTPKTNDALKDPDQDEEEIERKPLPYHFEKELINRQNKCIRIFEDFTPINYVNPLMGKFYAKHDQQQPPKFDFHLNLIEKTDRRKQKNRLRLPCVEGRLYGWTPPNVSSNDLRSLNYSKALKKRWSWTVHAEKLHGESITERPPFYGLRFIVQ